MSSSDRLDPYFLHEINGEEPHPQVGPCENHREKCGCLNTVTHIDWQLENRHEYIREVHDQHDRDADWKDIGSVRITDHYDCYDVVQQVFREVKSLSVQNYGIQRLKEVVSEFNDVKFFSVGRKSITRVVLEVLRIAFCAEQVLMWEVTSVKNP